MKKLIAIIIFVVALTNCFFSSFHNIENRAIHADEAEQASTFLTLYRDGQYKYNPNGPHGPTLYYWANLAENTSTKTPPENLKVERLRKLMLPILACTILAFLALRFNLGMPACMFAGAAFASTSLAQIYGAYFVQEIIFSLSVFLSAVFAWKFIKNTSSINAYLLGVFAGLAQASKETAPIALLSISIAVFALSLINKDFRENAKQIFSKSCLKNFTLMCVAFAFVVGVLYSSFGENPIGIIDVFKSYFIHFFDKASMPEHALGFWFYAKLLFVQKSGGVNFGELVITILALLGAILAAIKMYLASSKTSRNEAECALFFALTGFVNIFALSCISYKTPWLILSPLALICVSVGYFVNQMLTLRRVPVLTLVSIIALAMYYQQSLTFNAVKRFHSDPRNPFIYSHTVSDEKNLCSRLKECVKFSKYKNDIPIAFVGKVSPWPLPWQLRNQPNVGFWQSAPQNINQFDVVIADAFTAPEILKNIDTKNYSTDLFGLRKNTILTVFIKKEIFEKIISQ